MSSRLTKKSLVSVPSGGEDAEVGAVVVRAQHAQAADEDGHLGCGQRQQARLVDEQVLGRPLLTLAEVVAEAVGGRLEHGERLDVGLLLRRVRASRGEGDLDVEAGVPRGLLDGRAAAQHDQVGERDLRAARGLRRELLPDRLERGQHLRQLRGLVDRPVVLRREADAGAVGAAALVGAAERRRRGPGGGDELRDRQSAGEDPLLEGRDVLRRRPAGGRPRARGPATAAARPAPSGPR